MAVVTTGAGNPAKYMQRLDGRRHPGDPGGGVRGAWPKLMTRLGATALIAEGGESGGHVGELTTMVLVPQVCDATDRCRSLPPAASPTDAAWRPPLCWAPAACSWAPAFSVPWNARIHPTYKEKILEGRRICATIVTGKRLGHPVRSLRTPLCPGLRQSGIRPDMADEELEAHGHRRAAAWPCRRATVQNGCFLAGQIGGHGEKGAARRGNHPARSWTERGADPERGQRNGSNSLCLFRAGRTVPRHGPGSLYERNAGGASRLRRGWTQLRPGTLDQCFSGTSPRTWPGTDNTQPCMFAVELAAAAALQEAISCQCAVAGFSLGEIAALTYTGAVTPGGRAFAWSAAAAS